MATQHQEVAQSSHKLEDQRVTEPASHGRVGAEPADVHEFQQMVSDEDNPETSTAPGMLGSENVATGKTQPSSSGTGQRPKRQRLNESQRAILHSVLDDYIAGVLSSQQKQQVAQRTGLPQKKVLKYLNDCYRAAKKKEPAVSSLRTRQSSVPATPEPAVDYTATVVVQDAVTKRRVTTFAAKVPAVHVLEALRTHPGPGRLEKQDEQRTVLPGEPSLSPGLYHYYLSVLPSLVQL